MDRIQSYAKFFRIIFMVALIATPLLVGVFWLTDTEIYFDNGEGSSFSIGLELFADDHDPMLEEEFAFQDDEPLPWDTRFLGFLVTMIPTGLGMLSLWWLIQLFGRFSQGEIFTEATVRYIRYLGWTMIAGVAATPIYDSLLTMLLMTAPDEGAVLAVSLDSVDLQELITAGIIILVSWIMDEGRKLRETDELTV